MKTLTEIKEAIKTYKPLIKDKYQVSKIGIFGSYLQEKSKIKNDLDILVDYEESPDLWELIDLENYLSEQLQIKVDLVTIDGLKPRFKEQILSEVIYIS
jgi:uncharacterized protein